MDCGTCQGQNCPFRQEGTRQNGVLELRNPWPSLTVSELLDILQQKYASDGAATAKVMPYQAKALHLILGRFHPAAIDTIAIEAYKDQRTGRDGVAKKTVNNELSILRSAFRLGARMQRIHPSGIKFFLLSQEEIPEILPFRHADRIRKGFIEPEDFEAIAGSLPPDVADVVTFIYFSGWRVKEALGLVWDEIDWRGGIIELPIERSKNDHPRKLPISTPLGRVLNRRAWLNVRHKSRFVFTRNGKPMKDFRHAWKSACKRAGLEQFIPHDLRRSFVRNLIRSGVSRDVAMALSGHRTQSMFSRYNITDERDLRDAARKLELFTSAE